RLALGDARDHAVHPAGALAARGALAAALLHVEARDALAGADHARGLVHDDHRAGAEAGAGLLQRVVVHGQAHHGLAREHRHGRASGITALSRWPLRTPPAISSS